MKKSTSPHTLRRYRLTLEYDGTGYSGWQKQDDARTIQGTLLDVAAEVFGDRKVDIQGSGRTDAGVHALNYTAHLETSGAKLPPAVIRQRFNDLLPAGIVVLEAGPCSPRFHARHNCIGRSYIYRISKRKTAFHKKYVWWVKDRLNAAAMADAARHFSGMHDFAAFAEKQELKKSTLVMLNGVYLYDDPEILQVRVIGSHFLWKMVRRMVGVLVEVGRGNFSLEDVRAILDLKSAAVPARLTAPPSGLFFERAFYAEQAFADFLAAALEDALQA